MGFQQSCNPTVLKGTVSINSKDPNAKMAMPDSQQYPDQ